MKNILFVTSEAVPFIKTGGLADVAGTLPACFDKDEYDVRIILPKYACMKEELKAKMEFLFSLNVRLAWRNQYAGLFRAVENGITYYFVDNEFYFSSASPYGEARGDIEKFAFFCRSVLTVLPMLEFKPDVIHCHDWQASMIPVYLEDEFKKNEFYKDIKTVLTVHNLKFQGVYSRDIVEDVLGISYNYFDSGIMEAYGNANLLKAGLFYADRITTVSKSYSEEIKTAQYGEGLDAFIRSRESVMTGIVNGIDYKIFSPETDKMIAKCYSAPEGKRENKLALQREMGFLENEDTFLVGIVSRLTDQKGFDLISAVMDEMLQKGICFAVLGTGDKRYEEMFKYFEERYPQKIKACLYYSEELAHRIYAGADAFLMPSLFEPCGLSQLMSLRYGTVPIVRETGGLKDTVEGFSEKGGTGFTFTNYDAKEMLDAVLQAKRVFEDKDVWREISLRAMNADFSWTASSEKYALLYEELL